MLIKLADLDDCHKYWITARNVVVVAFFFMPLCVCPPFALLLYVSSSSPFLPSLSGDAHVQRLSAWGLCSSYLLCGPVSLPQPAHHPPGSVHRAAGQVRQRQDHQLPAPGPVPGFHCREYGQNLLWWACRFERVTESSQKYTNRYSRQIVVCGRSLTCSDCSGIDVEFVRIFFGQEETELQTVNNLAPTLLNLTSIKTHPNTTRPNTVYRNNFITR